MMNLTPTMNKTASDVEDLVNNFSNYYLWGPSRMEVHFGCECGCGGNNYTEETWDEAQTQSYDAYHEYFNFCKEHNITWDYE